MTNEAAERLREWLEEYGTVPARENLVAALAAERRAAEKALLSLLGEPDVSVTSAEYKRAAKTLEGYQRYARRATVEQIVRSLDLREHEYNWTWDADQWTDEDMDHAAAMIGDFRAILDEEAAR